MSGDLAVEPPTLDSEVRVTMDRATGQLAAVVDGVRLPGPVGLIIDFEVVPDGYDVGANGAVWLRSRQGPGTWTLTVDGLPVAVKTTTPERKEDEFFIRWIWCREDNDIMHVERGSCILQATGRGGVNASANVMGQNGKGDTEWHGHYRTH